MTQGKPARSRRKKPGGAHPSLSLPDATTLFAVTSNFSLGQLFARGILLPPGIDQPDADWTGGGGVIDMVRARVPFTVAERIARQARNSYPIAVEVKQARPVTRLPGTEEAPVFECICLSDVRGILFRSQGEKERFIDIEFSNYAIPPIPMLVAPDAFEAAPTEAHANAAFGSAASPQLPSAPIDFTAEWTSRVRRIDCALGLIAWGLQECPGRPSWVEGLARAATGKKATGRPSYCERLIEHVLDPATQAASVADALLVAATSRMIKQPIESGWAPEEALSEIAGHARALVSEPRAVEEVSRWEARALSVLRSTAEPSSLADDAFLVQRAVLLQLLRGELGEGVGEPTRGVNERTGVEVDALAGALGAVRTGLRALPVRFKRDPGGDGYRRITFLGERFYDMLSAAQSGGRLVPGAGGLKSEYRRAHPLHGEWRFTLGETVIASLARSVEPAVERLYTMGRHLGIEFEESGDVGLRCERQTAAGGRRSVFMEVVPRRPAHLSMVRFVSPVMRIAGVGGRAKLSRELAVDLLRRNAAKDVNCRFAIDDDGTTVVVLVDQLLATLDDAEFTHHIDHVVEVAEGFALTSAVGEVH